MTKKTASIELASRIMLVHILIMYAVAVWAQPAMKKNDQASGKRQITITTQVIDTDGDGWMNDVAVGVVDSGYSPVIGAKITANGWPKGTTGTDGTVTVRMYEPGKKTILATVQYKGLIILSNPVTVTIMKRDRKAAQIDTKMIKAGLKEMKERHRDLKSRSGELADTFITVVRQTIALGENFDILRKEAGDPEKIKINRVALDQSLQRMYRIVEQDRGLCENIESLEKAIDKQERKFNR